MRMNTAVPTPLFATETKQRPGTSLTQEFAEAPGRLT